MGDIVSQNANAFQLAFDFVELALQTIHEIGITITPLHEGQEHWWSELEYQKIPRKSGIYAIVNTLNGHFYIGSTINLYERKAAHFHYLQKDKHHSEYLQRAYNRYGADAFRFVIVERVANTEDLIAREQHYIDTLNPEYNIARIAGSTLGRKHTEKTKAKIGKTSERRTHSDETRKKISEGLKGNANAKGKPSPNKGKPMSEAQKAKQSEAMKGKPAHNKGKPMSEETKAKLSKAKKGCKHSEKQNAKMSEIMKGNTYAKGYRHTEETKAKMSELQKARRKREKQQS